MFARMTLGTKTIAAFGVAVVITLIVGAIGITSLNRLGAANTEIGVVRMPSLMGLQYVAAGQMEVGYGQRGLMIPRMLEPALREAQYERIEKGLSTAQMGWDLYAPLPQTAEEARIWSALPPVWEKWKGAAQVMIDLSRERDRLVARGIAQNDPRLDEQDARVFEAAIVSRTLLEESSTIIDDLIALNGNIAKQEDVSGTATVKSARAGMLAAIVAGAILMFGLGAFLARIIGRIISSLLDESKKLTEAAVSGKLSTRGDVQAINFEFRPIVEGLNATLDAVLNPIKEASAVLETLSNYDLRARMQGDYHGDHARIKESLNRTAQALHDSLSQVAEAVEQVTSASGQIASSSQQVAEGASEQASSLEETSSSLEEMSSMTKQNADNTQQAKVLTEATKAAADRGAASMGQMMTAMGKIRTASEGTAQIIRDINEIAFQTNLLALNAAVEAARAGEAGRGFAVVAEEVRNLAQRAKEAARKTEDLIHESVTLAESGEKLSREVGGNLDEILASVSKVAEIVNEVTTASREQAKGIDQVNAAVSDMDKNVQTAAANAEESSSAAQELAGQALELAGMVGRFQLSCDRQASGHGGGARRTAVSAPKRKPQPLKRPATRTGGDWRLDPAQVIPLEDETELATF